MRLLHWFARGFIPLGHLFSRYPLILLPLAGLFAIHWGLVLGGFDATHVIWSDSPFDCCLTGFSIGVLFGGAMTAVWWLDAYLSPFVNPPQPLPRADAYVAAWVLLCGLALAPIALGGPFENSVFSESGTADGHAEPLQERFLVAGIHLSQIWLPVGLLIALAVGFAGYWYSRRHQIASRLLWLFGWGPPIVVAVGYSTVSLIHWFSPGFHIHWMAASVTGLLLLGLVVTVGAGLHRFGCSRRARVAFYPVIVTFVFVFVTFGGWIEAVHRVPGLDSYYAKVIKDRPSLDLDLIGYRLQPGGPANRPLVPDRVALQAWQRRPRNQEGPAIAVSVSGGASTSAVFVARSLFRLETRFPGFIDRVRIISGASGGMLGAAHFVTQFRPGSPYRHEVRAEGFRVLFPNEGDTKAKEFGDAYELYLKRLAAGGEQPDDRERAYWDGMRLMEEAFVAPLEQDFLSPLFQKWVHKDLNLITRFVPHETANDRGSALELTWDRYLLGRPMKLPDGKIPLGKVSWDFKSPSLAVPFDELRAEEEQGLIPSLVFTPMLVEDGRQLIISNLDLGYMIDGGSYTSPDDPRTLNAKTGPPRTYSAIEFYRLFPEAVGTFRLGTAVRLNATFPLFTPATELPTNPPRRVVDAGYYDNFGLIVATRWIEANRDWLEKEDLPVWVVELWTYGYDSQSGALVSKKEKEMLKSHPDRRAVPDHALRSSTVPIGALFTAWDASMAQRGEERINTLIYNMNVARFDAKPRKDPIAYRFRKDIADVALPMNWVLSSRSLARLAVESQRNWDLFEAVRKELSEGQVDVSTHPQYQQLPDAAKAVVREKAAFGMQLYNLYLPQPKRGAMKALPAP